MRFKVLLSAAVIVAAGVAAGTASAFGQAALVDAIQTGNRSAAVKLIDQKVDVKAATPDGTTALHWAAHNGDADLVDRLIKAGADVNAKNEFGSTPIVEAALSNSTPSYRQPAEGGSQCQCDVHGRSNCSDDRCSKHQC